jgi:ankyrin repeat protein
MNKKIEMALKRAIGMDDLDAFKAYFQEYGSALNSYRFTNQNTFAHWAAGDNAINCLSFMGENGFDLSVTNADKNTLLWFSVMSGAMKTTAYLLEKGFNVNQKCEDGQTVLFALASLAMCEDNPAMLKLLVSHGADFSVRDKRGTPLIVFAANQANPQFLEAVIPYIEDINEADAKGKTALDFAELFDNAAGEKSREILRKNGAKNGVGFHENEVPDGWTMFAEEPEIDEDKND